MNRARLALCLGLVVVVAACHASGPVDIRIRNASAEIMEDIVVGFPAGVGGSPVAPGQGESGDVSYGTLEPGAMTPYRLIEKAYRYAYVEAVARGRSVVLQPIDYVGEELLEPGRYTYELDLRDGHLGLELVRD
jgi:hypothetical protein